MRRSFSSATVAAARDDRELFEFAGARCNPVLRHKPAIMTRDLYSHLFTDQSDA